mgnify:CR=1 FL=1
MFAQTNWICDKKGREGKNFLITQVLVISLSDLDLTGKYINTRTAIQSSNTSNFRTFVYLVWQTVSVGVNCEDRE